MEEFTEEALSVRIHDLLVESKITQAQFAQIVGVTRAAVNNWVRGKTVPIPVLGDRIELLLKLIDRALDAEDLPGSLADPSSIDRAERLPYIKRALAKHRGA